MELLGVTESACPACRRIVPAKILANGEGVRFRKFCPEHGESEAFVHGDPVAYRAALSVVKPAWIPKAFAGDATKPCPEGCGFCSRHEQHLCLPILEITDRCDLACPVCLVSAGGERDLSLAEIDRILDSLIAAECQIDVLTLSGGEPLMHPRFLEVLDRVLARKEIVRVSVSTNGLRLLKDPSLLPALKARGVVVSLQFDGFDDRAYEVLRGRPMKKGKLAILDRLAEADVSTTLTMTAAAGVNDCEFGRVLDVLFTRDHVVSLMIQPLAFEGRAKRLGGKARRLTIPDVVSALARAGHASVRAEDFAPLPCSHPLCFSLAFYLVPKGSAPVSLGRVVDARARMDLLANRPFYGLSEDEHERLKAMVYELWSGPSGCCPEAKAVLAAARDILRSAPGVAFDPRTAFLAAERRVKSVFIHAFQDADTFDLARARRCCNAYPQPDGRIVPACVRNVLKAGKGGA